MAGIGRRRHCDRAPLPGRALGHVAAARKSRREMWRADRLAEHRDHADRTVGFIAAPSLPSPASGGGIEDGSIRQEKRMLDLPGKVAIVTGAGSVGPGWGNGKATAVLLARQ